MKSRMLQENIFFKSPLNARLLTIKYLLPPSVRNSLLSNEFKTSFKQILKESTPYTLEEFKNSLENKQGICNTISILLLYLQQGLYYFFECKHTLLQVFNNLTCKFFYIKSLLVFKPCFIQQFEKFSILYFQKQVYIRFDFQKTNLSSLRKLYSIFNVMSIQHFEIHIQQN